MASTVQKNCASCGKVHTLYHPGAEMLDERKNYEYSCPTSREVLKIANVTNGWKTVYARPTDAVDMRRAK